MPLDGFNRNSALGERVQKDARGKTVFIYDLAGNLIAEANNGGHIEKEYIYIDTLPVAMIHQNTVYYIHADHLGQPQKMTDIARKTVWERTSDPFGETVSIKGKAELNLRFPGQYFDAESGLHYNMFRSYHPATGRYTQSDPIGLSGGLNTYSYVGQNPVNRVDPDGLYAQIIAPIGFCFSNPLCRTITGRIIGRVIGKILPPTVSPSTATATTSDGPMCMAANDKSSAPQTGNVIPFPTPVRPQGPRDCWEELFQCEARERMSPDPNLGKCSDEFLACMKQ